MNVMTKLFGASWRTTVGGYVIAVSVALASYLQSGHALNLKDPLLWAAVFIAVKGHFEKDKNVTGGTTPNTSNNPAVVRTTEVQKEP